MLGIFGLPFVLFKIIIKSDKNDEENENTCFVVGKSSNGRSSCSFSGSTACTVAYLFASVARFNFKLTHNCNNNNQLNMWKISRNESVKCLLSVVGMSAFRSCLFSTIVIFADDLTLVHFLLQTSNCLKDIIKTVKLERNKRFSAFWLLAALPASLS